MAVGRRPWGWTRRSLALVRSASGGWEATLTLTAFAAVPVVGALIPLKFSFHKDRAVIKTIFFCCTIGCGFAGTISIFSSKISSDRWRNSYAIYQSQAQVCAWAWAWA